MDGFGWVSHWLVRIHHGRKDGGVSVSKGRNSQTCPKKARRINEGKGVGWQRTPQNGWNLQNDVKLSRGGSFMITHLKSMRPLTISGISEIFGFFYPFIFCHFSKARLLNYGVCLFGLQWLSNITQAVATVRNACCCISI